MAEFAGITNQVWVLAGSTPMTNNTGAKMLSIDNSSWDTLCDVLEYLAYGDTYKKRIASLHDTAMTISGSLNPAETTGQNAMVAGATVMLGVYPEGTTVAGTQAQFIVTKVGKAFPAAGMQTVSYEVVCNSVPVALPLRP